MILRCIHTSVHSIHTSTKARTLFPKSGPQYVTLPPNNHQRLPASLRESLRESLRMASRLCPSSLISQFCYSLTPFCSSHCFWCPPQIIHFPSFFCIIMHLVYLHQIKTSTRAETISVFLNIISPAPSTMSDTK